MPTKNSYKFTSKVMTENMMAMDAKVIYFSICRKKKTKLEKINLDEEIKDIYQAQKPLQ